MLNAIIHEAQSDVTGVAKNTPDYLCDVAVINMPTLLRACLISSTRSTDIPLGFQEAVSVFVCYTSEVEEGVLGCCLSLANKTLVPPSWGTSAVFQFIERLSKLSSGFIFPTFSTLFQCASFGDTNNLGSGLPVLGFP